jgi:hypothetical protein
VALAAVAAVYNAWPTAYVFAAAAIWAAVIING